MKILLPKLIQLLIWIMPLIGLHYYVENLYNLSLFAVLNTHAANFSFSVAALAGLLAFVIVFLLFSFQLTSLANSLYLGLFGRNKSWVFLGNLAKGTPMYYRKNDKTKEVFHGHDSDREFNYSFNEVNRVKLFIKKPFSEEVTETAREHLHPYSVLSRMMLVIFFALPAMAAIHAIVLPVLAFNAGDTSTQSVSEIASFDKILATFNLNIVSLALIFLLSLFLAIYFSSKQGEDEMGEQIVPLPENIVPKNKVIGKPLIMVKTYTTKYDETKQKHAQFDTGFRRASFEFSEGFNPPVYVTLKFDSKKYPELEQEIKSNIKSKTAMELQLTGKLRIKVFEEEEEGEDKTREGKKSRS